MTRTQLPGCVVLWKAIMVLARPAADGLSILWGVNVPFLDAVQPVQAPHSLISFLFASFFTATVGTVTNHAVCSF